MDKRTTTAQNIFLHFSGDTILETESKPLFTATSKKQTLQLICVTHDQLQSTDTVFFRKQKLPHVVTNSLFLTTL